jgi:hypothetical protein
MVDPKEKFEEGELLSLFMDPSTTPRSRFCLRQTGCSTTLGGPTFGGRTEGGPYHSRWKHEF